MSATQTGGFAYLFGEPKADSPLANLSPALPWLPLDLLRYKTPYLREEDLRVHVDAQHIGDEL